MARYEVADGVAHKFWEITVAGKTLTVRWGRLGTRGQSQVKHFADDAAARREHDKLVSQKRKKGYQLVDGIEESVVAPADVRPTARSPELEAAVIADPNDEAALMVLGDWLQTQGDPRGELISLQHALKQASSDPKLFLERKHAADLHYKQHEATLLGPLFPLRHLFRLEWQLGYIRGAKLSLHAALADDPDLPELLRHVVEVPAAIALQELGFGHQRGVGDYQPEIDALAQLAKPAALRSLAFGDYWRGTERQYPANIGALSRLVGVFPQLRRLVLSSGASFGDLEQPELRYFEYAGEWNDDLQRWIARCAKLEHLVIPALPDDRADPLPAAQLPKLRLLRMTAASGCIDTLADSGVTGRLEGIELGELYPQDGDSLVERAAAFRHLKTFRISMNVPIDDTDYDPMLRRLRAQSTANVTVNRYYPY